MFNHAQRRRNSSFTVERQEKDRRPALFVSDGITPIAPAEPKPRPAHIALGMTVYNGERYLAEALDAVFSQNYRDFTLVVLDDCSADRSTKILTDRASREPRMLCFRN